MAQELSRAKEKNTTLIEDNRSLASQLVFYQEDAKTTSENLVIKDAEVMLLVMVAGSFYLALTRFCAPRLCHTPYSKMAANKLFFCLHVN